MKHSVARVITKIALLKNKPLMNCANKVYKEVIKEAKQGHFSARTTFNKREVMNKDFTPNDVAIVLRMFYRVPTTCYEYVPGEITLQMNW